MSRTNHQQPQVEKSKLSLDTIGDLAGGHAKAVINAALAAALRDTEDRGADRKARKVTIEIEMKKIGEDHISGTVKAKTALPPYQTEPTIGHLKLDGQKAEMHFNPHSHENPDQQRLPIDDEA